MEFKNARYAILTNPVFAKRKDLSDWRHKSRKDLLLTDPIQVA